MTAGPASPQPPRHPLHALTTYELRDYRSQLEHSLTAPPGHAGERVLLRQRLDLVLAEQAERAQLARPAPGSR